MTVKADVPDLAKCIEDLDKRVHDLTKKIEGSPAPDPAPAPKDPPALAPKDILDGEPKPKHADCFPDCIVCKIMNS